jgi:hypothetical protein
MIDTMDGELRDRVCELVQFDLNEKSVSKSTEKRYKHDDGYFEFDVQALSDYTRGEVYKILK